MEISKTKILFYALTFIVYFFSGYGTNFVSDLRDAVLAAAVFFSRFTSNTKDFARALEEADRLLRGVTEDCEFTCPSGRTPVKNKYHSPSSNGCGADILEEFSKCIPAEVLTKCCNEHDLCYDTCNNLKQDCDKTFRTCLQKYCTKVFKNEVLNELCKNMFPLSLLPVTFGCKSYLESQRRSCYCSNDDKKKKFTPGGEV